MSKEILKSTRDIPGLTFSPLTEDGIKVLIMASEKS